MILSVFLLIFAFLYFLLILSYTFQWPRSETSETPGKRKFSKISIVIIARNEEHQIKACLQSILNNNYPKDHFEIIVVDDHSEDHTIIQISSLNSAQIKLLSLSDYLQGARVNSFKKLGIHYAAMEASYPIIAVTDADCLVSENWLQTISLSFEQGYCFHAGPVLFQEGNGQNLLFSFQQEDMAAMMAMTCFGFKSKYWQLANGANMAFSKDKYQSLSLYANDQKHASGDDVFLAQAMARKYGESALAFSEDINGLVNTFPELTVSDLIQQRIRWATKNASYRNILLQLAMGVPFLFNGALIIVNIVCLAKWTISFPLLFCLGIKYVVDYILINKVLHYYDKKRGLKNYSILFFIYPWYISIIGFLSFFIKSYHWKGRQLR